MALRGGLPPAPLTVMNVVSVLAVFSAGALIAVTGSQLRKHARMRGKNKPSSSNVAKPDEEPDAVQVVRNAFRVNEDVPIEDLVEVYEDLRKQLPKMFKIIGQHVIAPVCVKVFDLLVQ
ncbi:hypothetical protein FVE85_3010 [Porphyridium purpureum]|uniref:Uncharacterized protein n=1 Tax=Porphyridium purpureum TaxID=35688 RepID=A0A5J4YTF1_PORPP|nr:hypothetical protein FVE85_3010 [Porphyridium purpureum]|eukprot:POR7248..scf227_4